MVRAGSRHAAPCGCYYTRMQDDVTALFLKASRDKLIGEYWPRMQTALERVGEEEMWWRPNESSNSIGNLLLHLNGNVGQWLVAAFERQEDTRNRPAEFSEREHVPRAALVERLGSTLARGERVLARLTEADLRATYTIQGHTVSGLHAVFQVVDHFGMHYGQVLYIVKMLRGEGLGFYRHLDQVRTP